METEHPDLVELTCAGCGRTTTFSPSEPEERRVCPFCTGQVPEVVCAGEEGDEHADG